MHIKKWASLLLALLFIGGCLLVPAVSAEQNNKVIRVGFPIQKGLTERDVNGNYSGYTYEYLEEIAQYTGWDYEFVEIPGDINESLGTMLEMLQKGELDLLGGMIYSEQTARQYDFAGQSYGSAYTVLNVLNGGTSVNSGNYLSKKPLRISALEKAATRIDELKQFCTLNNIDYELVLCQSEQEVKQALKDGRADAMLDVDVNLQEDMHAIAKFSPRPYYFATTVGNEEIIQQINDAILNINDSDPYFSTLLYEKYFNAQEKELSLSAADQNFIQQAGTLKAGILTDRPPFQYADSETGELKGTAVNLLNYISEVTGLQFELIPVSSQEELNRMAAAHEIDLVGTASYDYKLAREQNISLCRPYVSTQYIMLVNKDRDASVLAGKKLALPSWFDFDGSYVGDVVRYDTIEACIDAVNTGEADYTYGNSFTVQYYLNNPKYRNIRLIPQSRAYQACIGVVQTDSSQLLRIINKVMLSIPDSTMQSIIFQSTVYRQKYSLADLIQQNSGLVILIIAGLAVFIIAVLLSILHTRTKMNKQAAMDLKKHYQLYELSNEHFFEYDYAKDILSIFTEKGSDTSQKNNIVLENFTRSIEHDDEKRLFYDIILLNEDGIRETCYQQQDGTKKWLRISFRTIRSDNGRPAYIVGKFIDIDHEKREKDLLLKRAERDSLTGLYNVAACRKMISETLENAGETEQSTLFILDVDRFKEINDVYGHLSGDDMLKKVADILRGSFRQEDIVGRPGGDEFIAFVRGLADRQAVSEKCRALCEQVRTVLLPDHARTLSISLGAAVSYPGQGFDSLYQETDQTLYRVKNAGRDGYEVVQSQPPR